MSFVPESEVRESVARLYSRLEKQLGELLPGADIQHVGSTAIPGCMTKGDLDIQVRVPPQTYADGSLPKSTRSMMVDLWRMMLRPSRITRRSRRMASI